MAAEKLGGNHPCGGCGKIGRELHDGLKSTSWACSATCAVPVLRKGGWGVLAWIKV